VTQDEYRPSQRAALVAWHLAHGEGLRTRDVVRLTGLSHSGAYHLLTTLSAILPIYQDAQYVWQVCSGESDTGSSN
jgi:DNA-binding IclR family transcriptional regulator